ncbi:MAG: ribonuclease H-like domain-containing protein [bacterium]
MYKEYLETGDTKLLDAVKKYCKNDVKMTHLVFLYLLKYKKLHDE